MSSKHSSRSEKTPGNWKSLEEYENNRGLESGRVTVARTQSTPKAWVNQHTERVLYRESPFSTALKLGEIKKSNYTIKEVDKCEFDFEKEPQDILDKAFEFMSHDNGMTPIDKFFD